ncbi:unnamed protein product [Schistosoma margrebowiei]|uniref:Uncharacterized protein n=1 Tax=Schistosoma margrebowiei TaxID=48269 RepID=A0A183N7J0_9TREM|nr:unnamed protein product [Schistosoma margrebowiei]
MFTSDVSEPYEILKRSILKQGDLTDRQRLDQLFSKIDLQHGSATDMLQRMKEVIGLRTFDEGLFKLLFLSKFPQQVQAVLVSFQNNALDELAASADRILEITKSSSTEVFSVKENPQRTQNDITELCHTLTRYLNLRNDRNCSHSPHRSISRRPEKNDAVYVLFLFLLCCTSVPYSKEKRPDAAKHSKLSEECLPTTNSLGLNF